MAWNLHDCSIGAARLGTYGWQWRMRRHGDECTKLAKLQVEEHDQDLNLIVLFLFYSIILTVSFLACVMCLTHDNDLLAADSTDNGTCVSDYNPSLQLSQSSLPSHVINTNEPR